MDSNTCRVCIRRGASVNPRIRLNRLLYQQSTRCGRTFLRHQTDTTSGRIKIDNLWILGPYHSRRRFRRVPYKTGEVDGRAHVDEQIWPTQNFRDRFWNWNRRTWLACETFVTVSINNFRASVLVVNRNEDILLRTQFMVLHLRNASEGALAEQYNNRDAEDCYS